MGDEARMKIPIRPDGLQFVEHRRFQRGLWIVERMGWAGFAIIIALAVAGVSGRCGWFAMAEAEAEIGTTRVEFPQVARRGESIVLPLAFGLPGDRHVLTLGGDLLAHFDLEVVTPQPMRSVAANGGLVLEFAVIGPSPHHTSVTLRARNGGVPRLQIGVDGATWSTRTLILP